MIELIRQTKARSSLKLAVVSNEGREVDGVSHPPVRPGRIRRLFVSSCFVHFRKPDTDIFRMAIDLAQTPPDQTVYLDDRPLFVEVARTVGLQAIHHTSYEETRRAFAELGL